MKTSLIIKTYNWVEALELCLLSAINQSVDPDEIIIADDGSREDTRQFIDSFRSKTNIPIIHVWQEDTGFHISSIVNKAVAAASGDYIIHIDGDCILHKHFVSDHKVLSEKGVCIAGNRIHLREDKIDYIFKKKKFRFGIFSSFFAKDKRRKKKTLHLLWMAKRYKKLQRYYTIMGCNISFWREDHIAVNGYDEDFEGWGYEDLDFAARLYHKGIVAKRIRFACLMYHIYHKEASKDRESSNKALYEKVLKEKLDWCKNGVDKYLSKKEEAK